MPISRKILDELNRLTEDNDFKKLLLSILKIEDNGSKTNINFEKIVEDFVKEQNENQSEIKGEVE